MKSGPPSTPPWTCCSDVSDASVKETTSWTTVYLSRNWPVLLNLNSAQRNAPTVPWRFGQNRTRWTVFQWTQSSVNLNAQILSKCCVLLKSLMSENKSLRVESRTKTHVCCLIRGEDRATHNTGVQQPEVIHQMKSAELTITRLLVSFIRLRHKNVKVQILHRSKTTFTRY